MTDQLGGVARPQILLPGQSCVAEGPHDHSGMYVMHHALRRDLRAFTSAARRTPLDQPGTWRALAKRWARFVGTLHHHHSAEDQHYWPILRDATSARGTARDLVVLDDMAAEHAGIDPALAACTAAFGSMQDQPAEGQRSVLLERLSALDENLDQHLTHEETEALPLVQRVMTDEEFARVEDAISRSYPARMIPFLVPWSTYGLPPDVASTFMSSAGRAFVVLRALTAPWFARGERRTFAYADDVAGR